MPEIINCEVCGKQGIKDKEIVLAEYYEPISRHDKTRYECRAVDQCLDRVRDRLVGTHSAES